jgi:hypothetical protein
MSLHNSDNEELEVVDVSNSEAGPSTVCKPIGDNIASPKRKYTKKRSPAARHTGAWVESRYSSYSFLISALDGGEWSASRPSRALPRGKDPRYPLYRRLGGPQSRSGHRG